MVYELRIYHMFPGRMEAINDRFESVTFKLFQKHNMEVVDFWEDIEGKDKIYYILEHEDMESRNRNFDAFRNDPEWVEAKEASEMEGPIVKEIEVYYMKRVPYSPQNNK